jgi:hypothetical protein
MPLSDPAGKLVEVIVMQETVAGGKRLVVSSQRLVVAD